MSSSMTLESAAQDRKARLAQLRSLKRKQAPGIEDEDADRTIENGKPIPSDDNARDTTPTVEKLYLSGRNYDIETGNAKLGFEFTPTEGVVTLEAQAKTIAETTKRQVEEEEKADAPLDLFKLQPKKPNWDLKRDLERKLEVLNVRTDNAIARLVRERISKAQANAKAQGKAVDGDAVGMGGVELVEAMHQREKEEEEDERREREEDQTS